MRTCFKLLTILLILSAHLGYTQTNPLAKVNTSKVEFSPSISAEGDYMVFQSDKDASEFEEGSIWKLYSVHLKDGVWGEPVEIKSINDTVAFVAGPSLSYDGNTLYLTAFIEGISESEDIFYSKRVGETWGVPVSIGSTINTPGNYEGFPSISSDENSLYFVRVNQENPWDKKNKENCFKIYVSHRISGDEWSEPQPLPAPVNMGCEHAPRILADNKTLIFSSIRNGSKEGFDLYQSTLIGENQWSDPIPLSFLNTKKSDLSPTIPASGDKVYYALADDIATATIPEEFRQAVNITVHGNLTDKYKKSGIDGFITIVDPKTEKIISTHHTNPETGKYSFVLQTGKNYQIHYGGKNYNTVKKEYDLSEVKEYEARELDLELMQVYSAKLSVKDAEIETGFNATVSVIETSNTLNFDAMTLKPGQSENLELPIGLVYNVITEAKNYEVDTLKVNLKTAQPKQEDITVALKPKKVPVSISLGGLDSDGKKRKIRVQNERTGETIEADDNQTLLLRSGERYKVIVNSEKGYAYSSSEIDLTDYDEDVAESASEEKSVVTASTKITSDVVKSSSSPSAKAFKVEVPMKKLEKGTQITMEHILFETNSAELDESSFQELDQLVQMFINNPDLRIEIAAHTDDVGSESINLQLSQQRAQSVANYLEEKGIEKNRYLVKGYGEAKPRVPNDSAENRAKNRRVEFLVL